jgi:cellulose synthase/poly-beta-1,6-N-acetylglucosamine synthase-like glycosyltransferase
MLLGELLIEQKIITEKQLENALETQTNWGSSLGAVLLAQGIINPLQLAQVLAEQFDIPYYDFSINPPNVKLAKFVASCLGEEYLRKAMILPVYESDDSIDLVMVNPQDEEVIHKVEDLLGKRITRFVSSERDLYAALGQVFRDTYIQDSVKGLFYRTPSESAMVTFTMPQIVVLSSLFISIAIAIYIDLFGTIFWLSLFINLFYATSVGFKLLASFLGANTELAQAASEQEVDELKDEDLPVYTILLPMYREPEVLERLINGIINIDYPTSKLDVKVLLEEDDDITFNRLKELKPPANFEVFWIPHCEPKTKPKACNYGLLFAKGELLTIYDAEDVPERDQLKKVVVAFRKGPAHLVCIQAALNYYNATDNLLTRMFTLEYSYWFDYLLPGIDRLGLPVPLGGTSNHFRTQILRDLGGWDPFNVTEDADLGIRASTHNLLVATINSTTYEEANSQIGNWIRQRSRWIKGYMQTYLVHMRHPLALYRKIGYKAFLGFQLLVGGTALTFLINPILWITFLVGLLYRPWLTDFFTGPMLYISLFTLIIGNFIGIYLNMLAVFRRKNFGLTPYALLNPFYWVLHSIAAYKALYQLIVKPFYWEKTQHGLFKKVSVSK